MPENGWIVEQLRRLGIWMVEVAPMLDAGLPELILTTWLEAASQFDEDAPKVAAAIRTRFEQAVKNIQAEGPRLRLRSAEPE